MRVCTWSSLFDMPGNSIECQFFTLGSFPLSSSLLTCLFPKNLIQCSFHNIQHLIIQLYIWFFSLKGKSVILVFNLKCSWYIPSHFFHKLTLPLTWFRLGFSTTLNSLSFSICCKLWILIWISRFRLMHYEKYFLINLFIVTESFQILFSRN